MLHYTFYSNTIHWFGGLAVSFNHLDIALDFAVSARSV